MTLPTQTLHQVVVINDETVNAFVLPGGKIVVFTGGGSAPGVMLVTLSDSAEAGEEWITYHHLYVSSSCSLTRVGTKG